jgi:hypothetical protein
MTALKPPAPLPVVACDIVPAYEFHGFNTPPQVATVQNDSGVWIAAVAVPWALFHDTAFQNACMDRWQRGAASVFGAIAAELRARANFNQETTP